jgi:hypothetical protein
MEGSAPAEPWVQVFFNSLLDEFELSARHWVIFNDAEPVTAARMSVH